MVFAHFLFLIIYLFIYFIFLFVHFNNRLSGLKKMVTMFIKA